MAKSEKLNIDEAAELLGMSVGTLRRRIKAGEILPLPVSPSLKKAVKYYFDRAYIEALIKGE